MIDTPDPKCARSRRSCDQYVASILAFGFALSCNDAPQIHHTARDSAGIQIVENEDVSAWRPGREWRVDTAPALDIGSNDSDSTQILEDIIHARRLRDGRIAVVSYKTDNVRIYDTAGQHTQTIGRSGQGPGEFAEPWWVTETAGDSILILDIGAGFTFNRFTAQGEFVRRYGTPVSRGVEGTQMLGQFNDGTILVLRFEGVRSAPDQNGVRRGYTSFFRIGLDGEQLDSLGLFVNQSSAGSGRLIWGPWGQADAGRGSFYFGGAATFEIEQRATDGRLMKLIRLARLGRQMSDADVAAFKENRLDAARKSGDPRRVSLIQELDKVARFASQLPPYFYIKADAAGNVWAQEYSPHIGTGRMWSVFDTAGVFLGDVAMPDRFRVFEIGDDYVLGHWRDELDVEHVRIHRLVKPPR